MREIRSLVDSSETQQKVEGDVYTGSTSRITKLLM